MANDTKYDLSIEVKNGKLAESSAAQIEEIFGKEAREIYEEHVKAQNEAPFNRVYSEDFDDVASNHDTNNPNSNLKETMEKAKGYHEKMKVFAEEAEKAKIDFGIINEEQAKNRLYQQNGTGDGIYTRKLLLKKAIR